MPIFFDTNVLVYCADASDLRKQARARELVTQATLSGEARLSTQVLIELYNVLTRKKKTPAALAHDLVRHYAGWPVVDSELPLVMAAVQTAAHSGLSIWDAMMVEAALRSGAQTLYTEDLSHGQRFGALTVINPFITAT